MIDKVDVRIPESTQPGPALFEVFKQLRHFPPLGFRPSRFYELVCDLREHYFIDAVVHLNLRRGLKTHKVEIIDAGKKSLAHMSYILTNLFDVDPCNLQLIRVDLAADVEGVPVPWFRTHAYVNRKRFFSVIEKSQEMEVEFVEMGTAVAQTIYAGRRPNIFRIYNKPEELRLQFRKMERQRNRFNAGMEQMGMTPEQKYYGARILPTFAEFCRAEGFEFREGWILTRIERQIGGGRLPDCLTTFNDLYHANELEVFKDLRLNSVTPIQQIDSPPCDVPIRDWLACLGFNYLQSHFGSEQTARAFVFKHGKGNGKRILESLAQCAPQQRAPLTMEEIQDSYRKSTLLQLGTQVEAVVVY